MARGCAGEWVGERGAVGQAALEQQCVVPGPIGRGVWHRLPVDHAPQQALVAAAEGLAEGVWIALERVLSGPIGLEGDRGQMEYRRIRIKEMP